MDADLKEKKTITNLNFGKLEVVNNFSTMRSSEYAAKNSVADFLFATHASKYSCYCGSNAPNDATKICVPNGIFTITLKNWDAKRANQY